MLRFGLSSMALLLALALSANAQAGALSLLTQDGVTDNLEDNDYEAIISADGFLSVGDVFIGMFDIQTINTVGVGASTFEGVFIAKIVDVTAGGSFAGATASRLTFAALTDAEYDSLAFRGPVGDGTFGNLPDRVDSDSMIFVYDTTGTSPFVNPDGAGIGAAGINDALLTAQNGTLVAEFGADDGDEIAIADVNTTTIGPGLTRLAFGLGLNVTHNATPWMQFLDNTVVADTTLVDLTDPSVNVLLSGYELQVVGARDSLLTPLGDFQIGTDANFQVNTIPEPGSVTLFGLGALGLAGARMRRKNAA